MLVEFKEQKERWNFDHQEHIKVTKQIAKITAIDSQPFSIVEDREFIQLPANVCPR